MPAARAALTACAALLLCGAAVLGCTSRSTAAPNAAAPPTKLYLSPTGADVGTCTQAKPCRGLNHAYHVAKPGQTVEIAGGRYEGDQFVEPDASKTGPDDVLLAAAPGATAEFGEINVTASHFELRGVTVEGWKTKESASDVTFRNVKTGAFFIQSSSNINVIGGSVGPGNDFDSHIAMASPGSPPPKDIVVNGVFFHDWRLTPGSDAHVECLQVAEVDGLLIANSRFNNCETHNVFISPWFGGAIKNVTLRNNFGGSVPGGFYGFRIAAGGPTEVCENIKIAYNSAVTAFLVECGKVVGSVIVDSNVGPYEDWLCRDWATYTNNVWTKAKCGETDQMAPSGFKDAAAFDLHLVAGAAAIDRGTVAGAPARDIDGEARPMGPRPDAGADEFPQATKKKVAPKKKTPPKKKKRRSAA